MFEMFQSLEARRMLAGYATNPIVVDGTAGNDTIHVWQSGNTISIRVNGQTRTHAASYSMGGLTPQDIGPTYYVPKIVIRGLAGNDVIWGNLTVKRPMEIYGGAGNDSIRGGGSSDTIHGGGGNETTTTSIQMAATTGRTGMTAGRSGGLTIGSLLVNIEAGNDSIDGGLGNDTLIGSTQAACTIWGGEGNDNITCGSGNDVVDAGFGNDLVFGSDGADWIAGDRGHDTIRGGTGHDTLVGGLDNDHLEGNSGNDAISGESGNDALFGHLGNDALDGGVGNDWMEGAGGNDTFIGGSGNDTMQGQHGNDVLDGGFGNDWIDGGVANDYIDGGYGNDTVLGGADNDTLLGGGGVGTDWLDGGTGNDWIDGGQGIDSMHGNTGIDTLLANRGNETLSGAERVQIAVDTQQHQNDSWSCGPNSASRLLRSYGINANYETLRSQVQQLSQTADYGMGTPSPELLELMNQYKPSQMQQGANFQTVLNVLAQGRPMVALIGWGEITVPVVVPVAGIPIVTIATAPEMLHYICLTGFDATTQRILYTDTNGEQKSMSYGDFQAQWNWPGDGAIYETLKSLGIKKRTILW
jgi:Ca2+-binding RTX toxin-like protein